MSIFSGIDVSKAAPPKAPNSSGAGSPGHPYLPPSPGHVHTPTVPATGGVHGGGFPVGSPAAHAAAAPKLPYPISHGPYVGSHPGLTGTSSTQQEHRQHLVDIYKSYKFQQLAKQNYVTDKHGNPVLKDTKVPYLKTSQARVDSQFKQFTHIINQLQARGGSSKEVQATAAAATKVIRHENYGFKQVKAPVLKTSPGAVQDELHHIQRSAQVILHDNSPAAHAAREQVSKLAGLDRQIRAAQQPHPATSGLPFLDSPVGAIGSLFSGDSSHLTSGGVNDPLFHRNIRATQYLIDQLNVKATGRKSVAAESVGPNPSPLLEAIKAAHPPATDFLRLAGKYLNKPGQAVELGLGKAGVATGLIKGDTAKQISKAHGLGSVSGAMLTKGLFNAPTQTGLIADIATDPLMYLGGAGLEAKAAETSAVLSGRIARVAGDTVLDTAKVRRLTAVAHDRGEWQALEQHLRKVADYHGVSTRALGKLPRDRAALRALSGTPTLAGRVVRHIPRPIVNQSEHLTAALERANVGGQAAVESRRIMEAAKVNRDAAPVIDKRAMSVPDRPRMDAVIQSARMAKGRKLEPGFRLKFMTPLGNEISSLGVRVPDFLAERRILPRSVRNLPSDKLVKDDRVAQAEAKTRATFVQPYREALARYENAWRSGDQTALRAAEQDMAKIDTQAGEAAHAAGQAAKGSESKQSLAEFVARRNSRAYIHETRRAAEQAHLDTERGWLRNIARAIRPLKSNTKSLQDIRGYHLAATDTGSMKFLEDRFGPLSAKEQRVLSRMHDVYEEQGRASMRAGTLRATNENYMPMAWQHSGDPFAHADTTGKMGSRAVDRASYQQRRRFPEMITHADRRVVADWLQQMAERRGAASMSREEALKMADEWHGSAKIRNTINTLAREVHRGEVIHYADLSPLERQAYDWSQHMAQDQTGRDLPLFQDVSKTDGILTLHPTHADQVHGFTPGPLDHLPIGEQHATRMDAAIADRERVARSLDRLPAGSPEHVALSAQHARLSDQIDAHAAQAEGASHPHLLPGIQDVRDTNKAFPVMDPREAAYFRANAEGTQLAARAHFEAIQKTSGRSLSESKAVTAHLADGRQIRAAELKPLRDERTGALTGYVDRNTGKHYGRNDVHIPEASLVPTSRANDVWFDPHLQQEYVRPADVNFLGPLGEQIQKVIGPDAVWPTSTIRDFQHDILRQGKEGYQGLYKSGMEQLYSRYISLARFGVTEYFPGYHIRNMVTDAFNSLQADTGVAFHPVINTKLSASLLARNHPMGIIKNVPGFGDMKTEEFLLMGDTFGLRSQQQLSEFARLAEGQTSGSNRLLHLINPGPTGRLGHGAVELAARREDLIRHMTFLQRMRRNGGDVADALSTMIRHHFDYNDLTLAERRIARNVFFFYTWYRNNIPLQLSQLVARPGFFSAISNGYNDLAKGQTPVNLDYSKIAPWLPNLSGQVNVQQLGTVPDYMVQSLSAGASNWNGHALSVGFGAPWGDLNYLSQVVTADPATAFREGLQLTNPLLTMAFEFGSRTDILTGRRFKSYETGGGIANVVDYITSKFGVKLPTNQSGQPVLPWAVSVALRNVPFLGRGSSYFGSTVGNQAHTYLGENKWLPSLLGFTTFEAPTAGNLTKAQQSWLDSRAIQRRQIAFDLSTMNKNSPQYKSGFNTFDKNTLSQAKQRGIPLSLVKGTQGLGFYGGKAGSATPPKLPLPIGTSSSTGLTLKPPTKGAAPKLPSPTGTSSTGLSFSTPAGNKPTVGDTNLGRIQRQMRQGGGKGSDPLGAAIGYLGSALSPVTSMITGTPAEAATRNTGGNFFGTAADAVSGHQQRQSGPSVTGTGLGATISSTGSAKATLGSARANVQRLINQQVKQGGGTASLKGVDLSGLDAAGQATFKQYLPTLLAAAKAHGVPASLLAAQIQAESGWHTGETSSKGAQGLTQFEPGTAKQWNVTFGTDPAAVKSQIIGQARLMGSMNAAHDPIGALNSYWTGHPPSAVQAPSSYTNTIFGYRPNYAALDRSSVTLPKGLVQAAQATGAKLPGQAGPQKFVTVAGKGGFVHPFPNQFWTWAGLDEGVDFSSKKVGAPILALGDGVFMGQGQAWGPSSGGGGTGQGFVMKLTGPQAAKLPSRYLYLYEGIALAKNFKPGEHIHKGQVIAHSVPGSIEFGFSDKSGAPLNQSSYGGHPQVMPSAPIMDRLLKDVSSGKVRVPAASLHISPSQVPSTGAVSSGSVGSAASGTSSSSGSTQVSLTTGKPMSAGLYTPTSQRTGAYFAANPGAGGASFPSSKGGLIPMTTSGPGDQPGTPSGEAIADAVVKRLKAYLAA